MWRFWSSRRVATLWFTPRSNGRLAWVDESRRSDRDGRGFPVINASLDSVPLWILFLATCTSICVVMEGGYRLGKWRHAHPADEKEGPVGAMVGSILGLLAFLLAFTFGIGVNIYLERRLAVLEEANAIGKTQLLSGLLPEPEQAAVARMLRDYVDVRVRAVEEGNVAEAIARSEELHALIRDEAIKAKDTPGLNATVPFIQSLHELIAAHRKRVLVGTQSRIPGTIWIGLFGLTLLGMGGVGYQAGLSGMKRSPVMPVLVLAFASVFFLIEDLSRQSEGFLRVNQKPMLELQRTMHAAKS
jgi:hypothetical protein